MSPDLLGVLLIGGLFVLLALSMGVGTLGGWIGRQIEARQNSLQREAQAATKRADAERKLEETRIRRLELELGIRDSPAYDLQRLQRLVKPEETP